MKKVGRLFTLLVISTAFSLGSHMAWSVEVSPPSWWVGMKHTQLDLMLHHPNISNYVASTNYPGVEVKASRSPGGENYLIVELEIAPETKAGHVEFKLINPQGEPLTFDYILSNRIKDSSSRQGFSAKDVIYLITPDRFANGDLSNDAVEGYSELPKPDYKGGRHGGDIAGMIKHLDYMQDMGFTQIWTMPLLENAMPRYSYHGYSTTDFYEVDARFGSNEEYKELARRAKEMGIKLIL